MSSPSFQTILSGERQDVASRLLRLGLSALEPVYAGMMSLRNLGYDFSWLPTHAAPMPVISVGNITKQVMPLDLSMRFTG